MSMIFVAILLCFPAFVIYMAQRYSVLDKLGVVVLCFAAGIIFTALGEFPSLLTAGEPLAIQTQVTEVAIALAIPMLTFSMDLKSAFRLAGPTLKAMFLALLSVMVVTFSLTLYYEGRIESLWQVAGLSVGAYTGGGPNMAAISSAIDAEQSVFVMMTSYDILLSALYLLFMISIAKPIFSRFMLPFSSGSVATYDGKGSVVADCASDDHGSNRHNEGTGHDKAFQHVSDEGARSFNLLLQKHNLLALCEVLFFSVLALGIGLGFAELFSESMKSVVTIVAITTAGVCLSFIPRVKRLKLSFQAGMYLVLVFCFTMGGMTDIEVLLSLDANLFTFIALLLVGSLVLQALLCKFLKIDTDTFLITSSAAVMSVPFIPVIAGALKNKQLVIPGFAAAILGYVLGNYLGIIMAYSVRSFLG